MDAPFMEDMLSGEGRGSRPGSKRSKAEVWPPLHWAEPVTQGDLGLRLGHLHLEAKARVRQSLAPAGWVGKRDKTSHFLWAGGSFWARDTLEQGQLWAALRAAQAEVPPPPMSVGWSPRVPGVQGGQRLSRGLGRHPLSHLCPSIPRVRARSGHGCGLREPFLP